MFGKRPDGRVIRNLDPMQQIMPYVMKTRTDSMNMYEDTFACEAWDTYIKEKEAEGIKLTYMDILIAGIVILLSRKRSFCSRFLSHSRVDCLFCFFI